MPSVSKFSVLGQTIEIKDPVARSLVGKNILLLGDSFSYGYTSNATNFKGWADYVQEALSPYANVYRQSYKLEGRIGFANSAPFTNVIAADYETLKDKNLTDIVVIAGTNDIGYSSDVIVEGIRNFIEYCKATYPKAKISIGCIGIRPSELLDVRNAYFKGCEFGASYIYDLTFLCCHKRYHDPDGWHLTQAGYAFYAPFITNAILTGNCHFTFRETAPITGGNFFISADGKNVGWKFYTEWRENGYTIGLEIGNTLGNSPVHMYQSQIHTAYNPASWYEGVFGSYTPVLNPPIYDTFFCDFNIYREDSNLVTGEGYLKTGTSNVIYTEIIKYSDGVNVKGVLQTKYSKAIDLF